MPAERVVATDDGFQVVDDPDSSRFLVRVDGEDAGWLRYRPEDGWIVLVHTEVLPAFEGRGVASRFVRAVIDDIRRRGLRLTPACPYVSAWVRRHPEVADLVVCVRGPGDRPRPDPGA